MSERMFVMLFKALVRPHLEYASPVWTPHLLKDIRELEAVQRRATKQVPSLRNKTYMERPRILNIPTLQHRRRRGDVIEAYKILSGGYDIDAKLFFELNTEARTRGNSKKA